MKSMILVALALVAVTAALPVEQQVQQAIAILRSNFDQETAGGYNYGFEAENGIARQETGELRTVPDEENKPHEVVVVRGSYSYPGEDGKPVAIEYYADETGFHATGESIPKPARR